MDTFLHVASESLLRKDKLLSSFKCKIISFKEFKTNYTIHHSTFPVDYGNYGRVAHYTYLLSLTSYFMSLSCYLYTSIYVTTRTVQHRTLF